MDPNPLTGETMEGIPAPTVLLVEDNPDDAKMVDAAFQRSGIEATLKVVRDAEEATAYLTGVGPFSDRSTYAVPALILLDMNLPGRSGLQFVEWLRRREENRILPVIALTGLVDYDLVKKSFAAGVNSYLQKPKGFAELESALQLVLKFWLVLSARPR